MKRNKNILLAGLLALAATSCTDLDVKVESQYTEYPNNEIAVEAKMADLYYHMRGTYGRRYMEAHALSSDEYTALAFDGGYYDDGTETSREVYDFQGWLYNGGTTTYTVIPNTNMVIMADWEVDTLYYYEVSFNVSWVKPGSWQDNNSSLLGKITKVKAATKPSNSFRVLEGTVIDLSQYKAQCTYKYTGAWITKTYEFDVAYWSDQKSGQLYYNNGVFENEDYTQNSPYEIKDDVTFYAVWKMYKSY